MKMMSWSMEHWLVLLATAVIFGIPLWRIVARTGHPCVMAILFFIPLINVGMLWWLACGKWPSAPDRS
ncbi:hypothetical protein EJP69_28995 [Variovorax gossypii]|uniref:Uncharacterized protein n=2 Tax=Variovorax gossypii TaxID=1679495 RepID=A0A3S0I9Y0_9BURK|nr:hypothetical protein [Variovorax paradoxus]RTQ30714.1 hypothetical protein EJP69_28995 [Variovorax gossypii]